MPSVDDRIVRMEFDNASFERKLSTTLGSLDKLEKSLKLEGAAKGLSGVSQQASKMNFSGLANSVGGIADKFKTLSIVGVTALATIASKAVSAGIGIAKSLTLDNVIAGFHEYEGNINSIQTILSNTKSEGTNLQQVQAALDKLNEYSDKTIYNFGQMTRNIGTFTAAGVDLDTSVQSIKGISNLAAISGSSAEQASTAMYQLSQAISTGTLKLQDWNSVTNAGMGGKVFQKALFETGKTLKTIEGVPIDQTFDEWTKKGNSFRGSLQDGWLTSEVLTTTLQGFTGEMTAAQLKAIGYTKEQAKEILELGKTGVDAATKVRTLTGLIATTKEAIGSGWSQSFRIVFGNFKEATALFTDISSAVSNMVSKSADARNELLQGWKDLGGRTLLLESLKTTVKNLGRILKPIKEAFREIFPPATSKSLFQLTESFSKFAKALRPSKDTVDEIKRIFKGFFSILSLGWEVIKQSIKFFGDLFNILDGVVKEGGGGFLDFAAKIGDFFTHLRSWLVEGGALARFFKSLRGYVQDALPYINRFKRRLGEFFDFLVDGFKDALPTIRVFINKFKNFFSGLVGVIKDPAKFIDYLRQKFLGLFDGVDVKFPGILGAAFGRLQQRFETLKSIFGKVKEIWQPIKNAFGRVVDVLDKAWEAIKNWFGELKVKLQKVMKPGDFDAVLDAVNVGLLGGIGLLIAKWMKKGIGVDIGSGMLEKIGDSFKQLTGVMKAMETEIKAEALMKIAIAIGILTASVLVLSMIDSAALTKALTAMAIGFGQLLGSFAIINKISSGPKGAASFATIATGMILLSGAILILSLSVRLLAGMDWEELGKGLAGVAALMLIMAAGVKLLNGSGMIRAGAGMILIAVAINILAGAVMIFATMEWSEMAKGFAGVAAGLLIIAGAMHLMPKGMALQGVGLLLVATSLNILAGAVKIFATMSWEEIGKGMVGIAGSLLLIGVAMHLMPATMPIIGAGLLLVSISLIAIATAMKMIAGLSWEEIAKGMVGIAGSLLILAIAMYAMQGTIAGAIAMGIAAASLLILAEVLRQMSALSWGDLLKGLIGIAAVLAVLAIGALLIQPAIPALLLLGAALLVIGAGFALFGFGANLAAKAFETFAKVGPEGAKTIGAVLKEVGKAIPALIAGFAEGLLDLAKVFVKAAPVIAKGLVVLLEHILDGLGKLLPKALKIIGDLISGVLELIREKYPEFVKTGLGLLVSLLEGIRDNIGKVVHLVGEIITEFLDALTEEIPRIVESVRNLLVTVFEQVVIGLNPATLLFQVGQDILGGMSKGLKDKFKAVLNWFKELPGKIISVIKRLFGMSSPSKKFMTIGKDLLRGLFNGIVKGAVAVTKWFKSLAGKVLRWVGNLIKTLFNKGKDLLQGLWDGVIKKAEGVALWFGNLELKVLHWIGGLLKTLFQKGKDLLQGLWNGILKIWDKVKTWFSNLPDKIKNAIGGLITLLTDLGGDLIEGLWNGIQWAWDAVGGIASWLAGLPGKIKDAILNTIGKPIEYLASIGKDLMDGLWNAVKGAWDAAINWIEDKIGKLPGWLKRLLGIDSPSKMMMEIGEQFIDGFVVAIKNNKTVEASSKDFINNTVKTFRHSLSLINEELGSIDEFNPTITPVLDLTSVQTDAKRIGDYIQKTQKITPLFSTNQAQTIASSTKPRSVAADESTDVRAGGVKFEQNIYAPKQLSTNDIYKQTRNQIKMAKEELSIV